jgi:MFS transporter, DHA1 family, quinolone resistance protein
MSYDDLMNQTQSIKSIQTRYYFITFLIWFATALPLALMVLLAQARGMSMFEVGVALGVYSLTIVILEIPTGGLADAMGRKRVALLAFLLGAFYSLIFLFAFTFPLLLLAMIIYGISRALASGALDAWFVDALQATDPNINLQPALAGVETVSLLALGLGTLVGGALPRLFSDLPPDGTAILTPLAIPILASLLVKLVLLMAIALLIEDDRPLNGNSWRAGVRTVPEIAHTAISMSLANPRLLLLMSTSFVAGFAILSLEAFWQPFFAGLPGLRSAGPMPTQIFGFIMAGSFIVGMAGNLLSVPVSRLLGGRFALTSAVSRLFQGLSILGLSAAGALVPAAGFFWLAYLMSGVGLSPHTTLLNAEIPAERRSVMLSVQSLAAYAGGFLGGASLGYIADHTSITTAWFIAGTLTVLSLVPYLMLELLHKPTLSHVNS